MSVKADTSKLRLTINGLGNRYEKNVAQVLDAAGLILEGDMVESIQKGQKTGRVYKRGSVMHQASAPGEAPASDTGTLANRSISTRKERHGLSVFVGVNKGEGVQYAAALEFGTSKMAPRPFVRPALEKRREAIEREVRKAIKKANQEANRP